LRIELLLITKAHRLKREERCLSLARRSATPYARGTLPTFTWGRGPRVLLVHGWGGHAGRLTPFVQPLLHAGFSVVAFDAPAHGRASGRRSGMPEFIAAIRAVARAHGPFEAAIGHSLGAAACALALYEGLDFRSLVLLAPPADPEKYSGRFAKFFCLPEHTHAAMKRRLMSRYRLEWEQLRVSRGPGASRARLLVFHDPRDWKVPFQDGEEIVASWPRAELVRASGVGHHRIVRDPEVIGRAVQFLAGAVAVLPVALLTEHGLPLPSTATSAAALAWIVVMNSVAGGILLFVLLRRGTGAGVSGLLYLVPPVTAVLAVPVLGQPLEPLTVVGLALTLVGVVLVNRQGRDAADKAATSASVSVRESVGSRSAS